ncbi:MAG: hypothetical protein GY943_23155 [Chloroflexi bacterium]|nr:hypothetical protein [Chloroflexota bacterium]
MPKDDKDKLEKIILTRMVQLNAEVSGLVTGFICGLGLFIATNWLVIKGGDVIGPHLSLLGQFFIGYKVTFFGSIIGLFYGFVTGFIIGYAIAFLYNMFLKLRYKD